MPDTSLASTLAGNSIDNADGGGSPDIVIQLQGIVQQLSALVQAYQGRFAFGTFTFPAGATVTVADTAAKGNSFIAWAPTNAAAAGLEAGAKNPYLSARAAGTSFTLTTGDGSAAAGTEAFNYIIITPQ